METKKEDFFFLNLGFFMLSLAIVNFILPSKLSAGGTTGIAIIFYHIFKFPVSFGFFLLNLPLVVVGSYIFGKEYGLRTIYGIVAISFYTEIVSKWLKLEFFEIFFTNYPLIGSLMGGLLSGVGIGIVLLRKGNTGGTTILAQIIEKYFNIKIGTILNTIDISIIIFSGIFLGWSSAFLTIISIFICGKTINIIKYRKGSII